MSVLPHLLSGGGPTPLSSKPLLVLSILALSFFSTCWINPLYPLLTATVCWATVYAACWKLGKKIGRFTGNGVAGRRRSLLLAGCMLLAAVCDRTGGKRTVWMKATVPVVYHLFRELGIAGSNMTVSPTVGKTRIVWVITIAATIALGPMMQENSAFVLATCNVIFSALEYHFLEDCLAAFSEVPAPSTGRGGSDEFWSSCLLLGKEMGLYLTVGFGASAILFENAVGEMFRWQGRGFEAAALRSGSGWMTIAHVGGVGFAEAVRWMLTPLLVRQFTTVGVMFADLVSVMFNGLVATFSGLKLYAFIVATGGMGAFISGILPAKPRADQPGLGQRLRPIHVTLLVILCAILTMVWLFTGSGGSVYTVTGRVEEKGPAALLSTSQHPVPRLIKEAEERYSKMVADQSKSLPEAVKEYQRRYGRSPPPNFDRWYDYAKARNVVLIDEYDMIYHSLKPFWGMPGKDIRTRVRQAMGFSDEHILKNNKFVHIYVRDGEVTSGGQGPDWQKTATAAMISRFAEYLPDLDLPFNIHDEPRVVVPYDALNRYVEVAGERESVAANPANAFTPLSAEEKKPLEKYPWTGFNMFAHQAIWTHATMSCPPDSPVRQSIVEQRPDAREMFAAQPLGFITNSTASSDVCLSPSLRWRHGFFDRPNAFNVIQELLPVFSQSKMSSCNDILYPSPWYWDGKVAYEESKDVPWEQKTDKLYWRGSTTGGFSRNGGWKNQHRQRAVRVINANDTAKVLEQTQRSGTGNWTVKDVPRQSLHPMFDVHFSNIGQCDEPDCEEQRKFFYVAPSADQQDAWKWKYLLDMDGNAFSGRFYAFLESHSTVFKLAMFREWHDEWLVPWVHYVPLSMELDEVAEVMRFFLYDKDGEAHARRIAEEGRKWAKSALRNEDLEVWFFRLLLEYARLVDDNRDTIGFVG